MNTYTCKAADRNGKIIKTQRQGASVQSVRAALQEEGYFPVSIIIKPEQKAPVITRVSKSTLLDFTGLLTVLLESGLSVKDALGIVKMVTKDVKVTAFAARIEKDMNAGYSFSVSIHRIGSSLPSLYPGLIKAGESTGDLTSVFRKLNEYLVRQKRIREKLIGSSLYPLIVLTTALSGLVLISLFIIPRMKELFSGLGTRIPEEMQRTLSFSNGIVTAFLIGIPVIILAGFFIPFIGRKNRAVSLAVSKIKLTLPFAGSFIKDTSLLHILFILDALTSCGVTVEDALNEIAVTTGNVLFQETFYHLHEEVLKGVNLSEALFKEKIIPRRISRWVAVGERTGEVKKVFGQLASYYENELEKKSSRFMSIIEPGLILLTGILLFGIVLLIIVPLFSSLGSLLG